MTTTNGTNGHHEVARDPAQDQPEFAHDPELEAQLLGAVMNDQRLLEGALAELETRDFFDPRHQTIFAAMRNVAHRGGADVTAESLDVELGRMGYIDAVGGIAYLGILALKMPIAFNVEKYRDHVIMLAENRRLREEVGAISWASANWKHDQLEMIDELHARMRLLIDAPRRSAARRCAPTLEQLAERDTPPVRSYATGLTTLDHLIGDGISTRQLTTVLGPPAAGKSAFVVDLSLRLAAKLPVLYASTELEGHELMSRHAGHILEKPWADIVRGRITRAERTAAVRGLPIRALGCDELPYDGAAALERIERDARELAREYGVPPVVIIDYMQDLARGGGDRDLRGRVAEIATDLRRMAQRLDCPMIGVGSVSRSYYTEDRAAKLRAADDPTIYLGAAKESGDIDFASAVVMFLDIPKCDGDRPGRVAIAKSRHKHEGFVGVVFTPPTGRWREASESLTQVSKAGQAATSNKNRLDDADRAVLQAIETMHRNGERDLCTKAALRERVAGIATNRVPAAVDRLVHIGRAKEVAVERLEGKRKRTRVIYEPVGAQAPERPLTLNLDQPTHLHGGLP